MIYHGNRIKIKEGVTVEQFEKAMDQVRGQGRIPAVRSFIVGREYGTDYDWAAVFVLDDLNAYWEYLIHPHHVTAERFVLPLIERFQAYDITDDPDPDFAAKVADLQRRNYDADPELARLVAGLPAHTGSAALPPTDGSAA